MRRIPLLVLAGRLVARCRAAAGAAPGLGIDPRDAAAARRTGLPVVRAGRRRHRRIARDHPQRASDLLRLRLRAAPGCAAVGRSHDRGRDRGCHGAVRQSDAPAPALPVDRWPGRVGTRDGRSGRSRTLARRNSIASRCSAPPSSSRMPSTTSACAPGRAHAARGRCCHGIAPGPGATRGSRSFPDALRSATALGAASRPPALGPTRA